MASLKFAHLVIEKTGAEVHSFYIDMRTNQKDYEEFYQRLLAEGSPLRAGQGVRSDGCGAAPTERGKTDRAVRGHADRSPAAVSRSTW